MSESTPEFKEPTKKQLLWDIRQMLSKLVNKTTSNDSMKTLEDRINVLEQRVAYLEATKFQPLVPPHYPSEPWYVHEGPTPPAWWQQQVIGKTNLDGYVDKNGNITKPSIAKEFKEK